jgi:KDO2-lipid IV(A) lauroyltransferase
LLAFPFYYLPRSISLALGNTLGLFIAYFIPIRRKVVSSNLTRAFPEKSKKEIRKLTVETYKHFGSFVSEFSRQDKYSTDELNNLIHTKNKHLLNESVEDNNGVILLIGHFGNWELLGRWLGVMNYPLRAIQQPQENPLVDRYIQQKRVTGKTKVISKYASISSFIQSLQNGGVLLIAADQDARSNGIFVDFFGIPSSTARGAAVFAHKLKSPVLFCFPIKNSNNTYTFIFEKLELHSTGTSQAIYSILQQYMNRLEFYVTQYPEQYFWFHRRWKTQPQKQDASDSIAPSLAGAT